MQPQRRSSILRSISRSRQISPTPPIDHEAENCLRRILSPAGKIPAFQRPSAVKIAVKEAGVTSGCTRILVIGTIDYGARLARCQSTRVATRKLKQAGLTE